MDQRTEPVEFSAEQLVLFQAAAKELKVPLSQLLQLAETQHRSKATDALSQPQGAGTTESSQVTPLPEGTPAVTTSQPGSNFWPNSSSLGVQITAGDGLPTSPYCASWPGSHSHFFPMDSGAVNLQGSLTLDLFAPTNSIDPQFMASQAGIVDSIPDTSPMNMAHVAQLDTLQPGNSMASYAAFDTLPAPNASGYTHMYPWDKPEDDLYSTPLHPESNPSLYHHQPEHTPRIVDLDYETSLSGPLLDKELSTQDKIDMRKFQKQTAVPMRKADSKNARRTQTSINKSRMVIKSVRTSSNSKCVRCRFEHKKCVPGTDPALCLRCEGLVNPRSRLPCLKYEIIDTTLFRTMTDPYLMKPYTSLIVDSRVLGHILTWKSSSDKVFKLTQGFGPPVELIARWFSASDLNWEDIPINAQPLYVHQYAIANEATAAESINKFLTDNIWSYVEGKVGPSDVVTRKIFQAAIEYGQSENPHATLLTDVLTLWTAARTIEGGWRFAETETLGLYPNDQGFVPLTSAPLIDHQFSGLIVQRILLPLREKVLKKLQSLTYNQPSTNWFTLFMSYFILLHTYGLLMKQQRSFARRKQTFLRYTQMGLIRNLFLGAKVLLYHFHFICRGHHPFQIDWDSETAAQSVAKIAKLSDPQTAFMRTLVAEVRTKVPELAEIAATQEYEADGWFWGQLFLPFWKMPQTIEDSPLA